MIADPVARVLPDRAPEHPAEISDQALGCVVEHDLVEGRFRERGLMRRSTRDPCGDRKTMAVRNDHELGPLAPLGLSDARAPFLVPAKEPSMKPALNLRRPLARIFLQWSSG